MKSAVAAMIVGVSLIPTSMASAQLYSAPRTTATPATNVQATSATLNGRLDQGQDCQTRFQYRKVGDSTWTESAWAGSVDQGQTFSVAISALASNTQYEYQCQARYWFAGEGVVRGRSFWVTGNWSTSVSFKTLAPSPAQAASAPDVSVRPQNPGVSDILTLTISDTWPHDNVPKGICPPQVQGRSIYVVVTVPMYFTINYWLTPWQQQCTVGPLAAGCYDVYVAHGFSCQSHEAFAKVATFCVGGGDGGGGGGGGGQTTPLLVDSDFNASSDSAALRANSVVQDWYESRQNLPTLLTLDTTNVDRNVTKKVKLTASMAGSAYLTQEFSSAQTQSFTVQWDIYVDSIWDRPDSTYDCGAWMFIGDDTGTTPDRIGPNAEDSERFVYLSFYKPGGGSSGTMDLIARERSDAVPFVTVATGLSLKRWHTIRVICDPTQDTYEVYVDGLFRGTVEARTPKSSLTHISFAEWAQNEGAATFYVDNVTATGTGTATCGGYQPGDRVVLLTNTPQNSSGTPAVGLYAGTLGTVIYCRSSESDRPLFVSWDGWTHGEQNSGTEGKLISIVPNSGWWMACSSVAPWTGTSPVPGPLLVDSDFNASADSAALRANAAGQDWYESRQGNLNLLSLDRAAVGGNTTAKAKLSAGSSTSAADVAYLTQEFRTPQTGAFSAQWDIYVDSIVDAADAPDRAAWMLLGDDTGTDPSRVGPNAEDGERFVYLAFYKNGGGTTGTMTLVARGRADTWTDFTTVATGLSLKRWYTIKVRLDVAGGVYDVYVDGQYKATVASRTAKSSVTHITFAQWSDGPGTFYVDNVTAAAN